MGRSMNKHVFYTPALRRGFVDGREIKNNNDMFRTGNNFVVIRQTKQQEPAHRVLELETVPRVLAVELSLK